MLAAPILFVRVLFIRPYSDRPRQLQVLAALSDKGAAAVQEDLGAIEQRLLYLAWGARRRETKLLQDAAANLVDSFAASNFAPPGEDVFVRLVALLEAGGSPGSVREPWEQLVREYAAFWRKAKLSPS